MEITRRDKLFAEIVYQLVELLELGVDVELGVELDVGVDVDGGRPNPLLLTG